MPEYNEGCTGYADGSISDTPFLFLFFIFVSSLSLCLPPSLYPCTQGESIMTVGGPNNSSSEIGSDKVILLHNKAHGEAEKFLKTLIFHQSHQHTRQTSSLRIPGDPHFKYAHAGNRQQGLT